VSIASTFIASENDRKVCGRDLGQRQRSRSSFPGRENQQQAAP